MDSAMPITIAITIAGNIDQLGSINQQQHKAAAIAVMLLAGRCLQSSVHTGWAADASVFD